MKRQDTVRLKVIRVVMITTFVALLVSATALLIYELLAARTNWLQDLKTQAVLVAQSSVSALAFDDSRVATENLALLQLRPQIEAATIYAADDKLFAQYAVPRHPAAAPLFSGPREGHEFNGGTLILRQPVVQNGETIGIMVLQARYEVLPRLFGYGAILFVVMLASLVLAAFIATRLQRAITDPIVAVADVARDVMQQRNYSLRAPKSTDDEVGQLVDAFNDMLKELGDQAEVLKLADRRKDEFLATLAHELRNPLAALSTALAVLTRGELDARIRDKMRQTTKRQIQQLVRLIDDLLEVSRISTGRMHLQAEVLDLVELIRQTVESALPTIQERSHELVVAWPKAPVWVTGDGTRLAQVFINLLNNAAKYTDPGGRITIEFEHLPDVIEVRVDDNGIGIAPEMQEAVFGLFVQVDQSLERGRAGLGVGLSLTRQLVELHGGTVRLHSAGLGQGASFAVRLPLAESPLVPSLAGDNPTQAHVQLSSHILIADDNRDFADGLAELLRDLGHKVRVVGDGKAALQAVIAERPAIGLFDVGMPGLNGYELATAVRALESADGILLVAITGWGQAEDQRRAREAGFDHHIVKPVDVDILMDLLRKEPSGAT